MTNITKKSLAALGIMAALSAMTATHALAANVPAGVQRFSVTELGTVTGIDGASYSYSHAQAVTPR